MGRIAVRAEGLAKRYRIGTSRAPYKRLTETIMDGFTAPIRRLRRLGEPPPQKSLIWALHDVSFEVEEGEVLGVIGRNGAGKSTLLRVLSRITEPTKGRAEVFGRVGSLLEVGTGFHPELTGRENVYLYGAILGMHSAEIKAKFEEIVEFSGFAKFIDTPMKHFSSGMQIRLAFAVAANLEPEILVIDEVLAVGDAKFQEKCIGKMRDVTRADRTVLFVSHNMGAIRDLCDRTIVLDEGRLIFNGDTEDAVNLYLERNLTAGAIIQGDELQSKMDGMIRRIDPFFRCTRLALLDAGGMPRREFASGEEFVLEVDVECYNEVVNLQYVVILEDENSRELLRTENRDDAGTQAFYHMSPGSYRARVTLPANYFGERRFFVSVHLIYQNVEHLVFRKALSFEITFEGYEGNASIHSGQAYLRPKLPWQMEQLANEVKELAR